MIDATLLWTLIGFFFASYAVIANDSVQTLGTWMASNSEKFKWTHLWVAASAVLLCAIWYGWFAYNGDISYGRLTSIPYVEPQWYHALAPGLLLVLTRFGVPVSTSFLVLSAFASGVVLSAMLEKSVYGYIVAATAAYTIWYVVSRLLDETKKVPQNQRPWWRTAQWFTTGLLWWTWLSHDMANIAVFLPRELSVAWMITISIIFVSGLGWMFREKGGKIQTIVLEKSTTKFIRSATLIDLVYFIILWIFKEWNNVPMSTTWVFVGILAGRELAIATFTNKRTFKQVFPLVGKDFLKMMVGIAASVGIVMAIQYQ